MGELRKFVIPEFVYGEDARYLASQFIINIGVQNTLLVTDENIEKTWWFHDLIDDIRANGIEFKIFNQVSINPKDHECSSGAEMFEREKCDAIFAIGGGSVLDCAKGIGILVSNGGSIADYEGVDKFQFPIPPIICIPTTSGSAADVSQFAIITNTEGKYKMAHISKMLVPDVSLIDPVVTLTMPYDVTIDTALDTLAHAVESYVSPISSFMTEPLSLSAIRRVVEFLPLLNKDLDNIKYRDEIMKASLEAGLAFSNASLGLVHALAHSLGGYLDLSHGELNGKLLSAVVELNYESTDKYKDIEDIIQNLHSDLAGLKLYEMIIGFLRKIDIVSNNFDIELDEEVVERMAAVALNDPCIHTNPKDVELPEAVSVIEQIFKRAD